MVFFEIGHELVEAALRDVELDVVIFSGRDHPEQLVCDVAGLIGLPGIALEGGPTVEPRGGSHKLVDFFQAVGPQC